MSQNTGRWRYQKHIDRISMKTSDVLDIGYARIYGFGQFRSWFDRPDATTGSVRNTLKMVEEGNKGIIKDFIQFYQFESAYFEVESELELVADNENLLITIRLSTPLDSFENDDWVIFSRLNAINKFGNACAASYDPASRCVESKAYICFVGYPMWQEENDLEEIINFSSSPEIEGFINLMSQVFDVAFMVTKFVSGGRPVRNPG